VGNKGALKFNLLSRLWILYSADRLKSARI